MRPIHRTSCTALLAALLSTLGSAGSFYDSLRSIQSLIGISGNASHGQEPLPWAAACELLSSIQPDETLFPGTAAYEGAKAKYWDRAQRDSNPGCIFQPRSPEHVSLSLVILQHTKCPFAIKSGGHGQWHGESSIDTGVTIDLARIAHLELDAESQSLSVGPGNRWVDVYTALEPLGLTVIGGRSAYVGVGGLLQGGGISFHSNLHGWALDNIKEFQVVLGNGTIARASHTENPTLYKALRGRGANFGVVTSFVLDTYPYTGGWGGIWATTIHHEDAVIDALLEYGEKVKEDPKPSFLPSLHFHEGQWIWAADLFYCDGAASRPAAFDKLYEIPAILDTTGPKSLSKKTWEMAQSYPEGDYNTMWVFCTKVDKRLIKLYSAAWQREGGKLVDINGIRMTAVIQLITVPTTSFFSRRGGNALGLSDNEPFLMFNIEPHWKDATQSARVYRAMKTVADEVMDEAGLLGLAVDYTYINYASQFQDGFGRSTERSGAGSGQFLAEMSRKYDPKRVFQDLRGAGFKLDGAYLSEAL
ncbi:FAD binding domain-containing protein [Dactylonectria estremocensis]|uniref:FAD binding domain-containing protein n=1 Tax=Dactylonectria estremocensis TaxID=1079267 RepID=A0A9P9IDG9_9HYPO|nr:FAD binding domain-containing protein [Dactylonectria estremocensis]